MNYPEYAYRATRHIDTLPPYGDLQQIQVLILNAPAETEAQSTGNQTLTTSPYKIPNNLRDKSPINITSLPISGI